MRFLALATDYDGTLAIHGRVPGHVKAALLRLKASGRKLILVTGRELADLKLVFPDFALFDRIVAENGAHIYRPDTGEERFLGEAPPDDFMAALVRRGVPSPARGKVIVATHEPHQEAVLESIHELGLEHQVIFNKGAVMVLPPGINKSRGLAAALADMSLSPHNVVAVGDAENDHALLDACECGVAVSDALGSLKARADLVTVGGAGDGVAELVERMVAADLRDIDLTRRRGLSLGKRADGTMVRMDPHARGVLLAGTSGAGKTTLATAFLETLGAAGYQYCVLDPEGDYGSLEHAVLLGDAHHPPLPAEAVHVLANPEDSVALCNLAVPFEDRPDFFQEVLTDLLDMRARTGRPHWIILDEAHHLIPAERAPALQNLPNALRGFFLITLHPSHINRAVLEQMDWVLAVGEDPGKTLADFAAAVGRDAPAVPHDLVKRGEALAWKVGGAEPPFLLHPPSPRSETRRHIRKYSAGELGLDKSFHFRGPDGRLNLRAQNLMLFLQIAEGVDDATWSWHRKQRDYSRWFRESIKDPDLAREAEEVEANASLDVAGSRAALRSIIERRYTGPA